MTQSNCYPSTHICSGIQGFIYYVYISYIAPGDYTASGALAVNFEPGQLSITVSVAIRNDNMVEPDETFFGRLRSTGVGDVLVTQDRAQITIINDGDKREEINITINGDGKS